MGWIAFGFVIALIITIVLWIAAHHSNHEGLSFAAGVVATFGAIVVLITAIVFVFAVYDYQAAGYKAQIINREYGTSYTQDEVFWAEDVIDTIREIDRTRIEANGNLLRSNE